MNAVNEQPWMDVAQPAGQRAALLLAEMTLEEKVDLMTGDLLEGVEGFSAAGIDRLGIPPLRMADAGSGMRRPAGYSATTAMPAPIALAATWQPELGAPYGRVVADECYLLRHNVLLGPNADLARVPWAGRIGESVGEDTFLAAEMSKQVPAAVQRPGVMVTYKHPLLYNQESNRGSGQNSIADERTIREVYAPPFDAVIRAGAVSLMSSFNKINGEFACESDFLQNKLLRDAFGFAGFIMSDYFANHAMVPGNGLDMELPGLPLQPTFYAEHLVWAVRTGSISEAVVNRACTRILWAMFTTGLFDTPLPETDQPIPYAEHAAVARAVEEAAITLLKNDGATLPLSTERVRSIAVIGADTDRPARLGGSSFVTIPSDLVGILRGISERVAGDVEVRTAPGTDRIVLGDGVFLGAQPISSSLQSVPGDPDVPGVRAEFFGSFDLTGDPIEVRIDPDMTFNNFAPSSFHDAIRSEPPRFMRSLRATTVLTAPGTGAYTFTLAGWGSAQLWVDGVEVARLDAPHVSGVSTSDQLVWDAGSTHELRLEFRATGARDGRQPGSVQLGWTYPEGAYSPAIVHAAQVAAGADAAVVFVRTLESENEDSGTLSLPRDQDALVAAVAAANPHTIVVLGTGAPVLTPWADRVPAILHAYFGGQEQGHAIASVLFGEVNPSGKLPYTMAQSEQQYARIGIQNPVRTEWSKDVHYVEGLHLGYRGFDRHELVPQYPFGHGLSYTRFAFDGIVVTPEHSNGFEPIRVAFQLANVGETAGAEVAQAYLEVPDGHGEPVRKLVAFRKVFLQPGETTEVELVIDPFDVTYPLARWDNGAHLWRTIGGVYTVRVGSSSRDLPLSATFEIHPIPEPTTEVGGTAYAYVAQEAVPAPAAM
ncbi:glycoside hydrolase family 3 protein [Microbacterium sp. B2969]|uniref:Glycoside hydrolase family 3 protein n=1 Tax=Microbacterium alkaliflavum TaxID=3248839 RepID=A0ABW7QDS4_9MICO